MMTLNDIETIEGLDDEATEEDYYYSMQRAINSGSAWSMQGSYGRAMMDAISAGRCMLGRDQVRDYYGNIIPSRDDVQAGTKGSYQFVVKQSGLEWADLMLEA
jgi:hypothetical protein